MILGNSNGNNQGKKYLKDKEQIDKLYAEHAYSFEVWFNDNYNILVSKLSKDEAYNDDVFHDTFMSVRDQVLYKGCDIKSFENYFFRAYFTNSINSNVTENNIESFNDAISETKNELIETSNKHLNYHCSIQSLFEYLDRKLEPKESELLKIYYINEMSIREISEHLKIKYYVARYILRKAKNKLKGDTRLMELINDPELKI